MVKKTKAPDPKGSRRRGAEPTDQTRRGASRRVKLRLASEVSLIPTMFLGCVVVGYYLGGWAGQFLPGGVDKWSGFGVLYGLAAAIYYTYKIIRRIVEHADDRADKPVAKSKVAVADESTPPADEDRDNTDK